MNIKIIGEKLEIIKNIFIYEIIYIFSDMLIKAIAFISMPFFLNKMNPDEFGLFNLYTTYIGILAVFIGLNVSNAIVRYKVEKIDKKKYLATPIWIIILNATVLSGVFYIFSNFFHFIEIKKEVIIVILISTVFSCFIHVGLEIIRSEKNAILYGFVSVLHSIFSIGLGLIFIYKMEDDLGFWRLVSIFISSILVGGALVLRIVNKYGIKGNIKTARYLLSYSMPLIPYTFSTIILSQVNILFLSKVSLSQVGVYSFASNIGMIVSIIAIALNRSLQPNLFEALRDNRNYKNHLKRNIGIFYFFYITFIISTDLLIFIFGNKSYLGAVNVVPILILAYGYFFLYSLFINFMYYYKKNFKISLFSILSAGIAILSNWILVNPFGYIGAALATLVAYFSLFAFSFIYVTKKLNITVFSIKTIILLQLLLIFPVIIKIFI
ncbi:lipopolysaccharide biosynthesis protein [Falsibacillus albus]|uniref:Uncharacterized protein n=1 Tax=Falsibacillus albus TaxID=2478915 RepID=A0A3L7JVP2_9BACI|nr:oligosaccharide flippase family protein [Falsibacillus albus]RLQ94816.1 hypothetical protein D9X91_12545 [Falsibacillus albus]